MREGRGECEEKRKKWKTKSRNQNRFEIVAKRFQFQVDAKQSKFRVDAKRFESRFDAKQFGFQVVVKNGFEVGFFARQNRSNGRSENSLAGSTLLIFCYISFYTMEIFCHDSTPLSGASISLKSFREKI